MFTLPVAAGEAVADGGVAPCDPSGAGAELAGDGVGGPVRVRDLGQDKPVAERGQHRDDQDEDGLLLAGTEIHGARPLLVPPYRTQPERRGRRLVLAVAVGLRATGVGGLG